jgi:hypothetical protein
MAREPNKRPRRTPLSSEEVSNIIAYRKKRDLITLQELKKTRTFKLLNLFNISCIFIYLELLFCYAGPCNYQRHYSLNVTPKHCYSHNANLKSIVSEVEVVCVNGGKYNFIVEDFIEPPGKRTSFLIGRDFILRKELKGRFENSDTTYRLFSASPILFLAMFISFICYVGFGYNLNENSYSLSGLTMLNLFTLLGIMAM